MGTDNHWNIRQLWLDCDLSVSEFETRFKDAFPGSDVMQLGKQTAFKGRKHQLLRLRIPAGDGPHVERIITAYARSRNADHIRVANNTPEAQAS